MNLPFVLRRHFDLLQHNYDQLRHTIHSEEDWARALDRSERRYDELLEKFCAMKLQGAVIPEPVVIPPKKEADPVVQQINALSAGKPGLRSQMMKQLNTDRTVEQLDDVEIMRKIEMGVVNEDGVPA